MNAVEGMKKCWYRNVDALMCKEHVLELVEIEIKARLLIQKCLDELNIYAVKLPRSSRTLPVCSVDQGFEKPQGF